MTFVLRTQIEIEAATADLATPELLANIIAAYKTADILLDQDSVDTIDGAAYRFNEYMWRGHTLSLLTYAEYMAEEYTLRRPGVPRMNTDWVNAYMAERSHLVLALGSEGSESMVLPDWVQIPSVRRAHRQYLRYIDPEVYDQRFAYEATMFSPLPLPIQFDLLV